MTEDSILYFVENSIARVTLNRPEKMNALNPEMVVRLARTWDAISADPAIRVAVLTGAGDRTFCAGADMGRLIPLFTRSRPAEDEWDEALLSDPKILNRAMLRRHDFFTPVVGAFKGTVVAGGMELALGCDLRVVSTDSALGLMEVKRGLIPAAGGVARVSRQIPWAMAAEILLMGDKISAQDALRAGLVNRVVPADQVLDTAMQLAQAMTRNSPLAMRAAKETMLACSGKPLVEAFDAEDQAIKKLMRSEDVKEGARAFMEKREPRFVGR